jgi:putative hemolysin
MLAMFPSGEVSHMRLPDLIIADPEWNSMAARLVRTTGADALPVFFLGRNSATFQALGLLHPRLRTARLISEFLLQTDRQVEVRIGSPVPAQTVRDAGTDAEAASYLRWRTYILAERSSHSRHGFRSLSTWLPMKKQQEVAARVPRERVLRDLEGLGEEHCLYRNREFSVYLAEARQIPDLLEEVGNLRETTFRAVGEGTGNSCDLDRFDYHYKHILLWSNLNRELAGAYRMGLTSEILPDRGVAGLYTNTLFRYDDSFFEQLGPAIELGRSFVCPEYQRQYSPLLMLWKGIGRYLAQHPEFPVLFGAVSISNRYSHWSREMIVRFFREQPGNAELAKLVNPRTPFHPRRINWGERMAACAKLEELEQLTAPISDVEHDGKGVPILIKHYAKLGGRLVSFNVDRNFSNALDGLVVVDLRQADPTVLGRYVGQDGIEALQRYHRLAGY